MFFRNARLADLISPKVKAWKMGRISEVMYGDVLGDWFTSCSTVPKPSTVSGIYYVCNGCHLLVMRWGGPWMFGRQQRQVNFIFTVDLLQMYSLWAYSQMTVHPHITHPVHTGLSLVPYAYTYTSLLSDNMLRLRRTYWQTLIFARSRELWIPPAQLNCSESPSYYKTVYAVASQTLWDFTPVLTLPEEGTPMQIYKDIV